MRCRQCNPVPEEIARAADLLGRRWMLAIVWAAAEEGAVRWNEFKQALEGIPPRTLAQRLAELEEAGVLERRVLPDSRPPRVEYRLTAAGTDLAGALRLLAAWAGSGEGPRHAACGTEVEVRWWCPTCQRVADDEEEEWV